MNKIIIVGHAASGFEEVESLLFGFGMKPALPSRREGLYPKDIATALRKAHQMPAAAAPTSESDFKQLEAGPVWSGMALDLLLGNLDQELWGWADPETIFLLDYWCTLDPEAAFVLVYDEPQRVVAEAALPGAETLDEAAIHQRLDNWAAYNGAMLRFFLRNPSRCLLVHSRQVRNAGDTYLSLLQARLNAPLQVPEAATVLNQPAPGDTLVSGGIPSNPVSGYPGKCFDTVLKLTGHAPAEARKLLRAEAAESFIINHYLAGYSAHVSLYEELQAAASMPLNAQTPAQPDNGLAWKAFLAQRHFVASVLSRLNDDQHDLQTSQQQAVSEQDLLFQQLHHVQEELESQYFENAKLKESIDNQLRQLARLEREKASLARTLAKYETRPGAKTRGAAKRVKQQLSYRLGFTMVTRSRSIRGLLGMPIALLRETIRFRRDKANQGNPGLPPLSRYSDWPEAQRVQQQLSYRLGCALVKNLRSPVGWIKLPFALGREIARSNKNHNSPPGQAPRV